MYPYAVFDCIEREANRIRKELKGAYVHGVPIDRWPLNDVFLVAAYNLGVHQYNRTENQMYAQTTLTFDKKEG